jgi:hypothetical protein
MPDKMVVLVPGLLGSTLIRQSAVQGRQTYWVNRPRLLAYGVAPFWLDGDGETPLYAKGGVDLEPSTVPLSEANYEPLLARLILNGWSTELFAYDWRLDIRDTAARLASRLSVIGATQDYYVLCHSMGGLVARLAYPLIHAAGSAAHWRRSVYIGTPHFGSAEASQYMATVNPNLDLVGYIAWLLDFGQPPLPYIQNAAKQPDLLKRVIASWPSVYQLMPRITGDWGAARPLNKLLYEEKTYKDQNPYVKQKWLDESLATQAAIDATLTGPRPSERCIIGAGLPVSDTLLRDFLIGFEAAWESEDGDGAVTQLRATLPGAATSLTITPGVHRVLPTDPLVMSRISGILGDDTINPATASPPPPRPSNPFSTFDPAIVPRPAFPALQRAGDP